MINVSEDFKQKFSPDSAGIQVAIRFYNSLGEMTYQITNDKIKENTFKHTSKLMEGNNISVIGCISSMFECDVMDAPDLNNQTCYIAVSARGSEEMSLGKFRIDSCKRTSDKRFKHLIGYDDIYWMEYIDVTVWYNNHERTRIKPLLFELLDYCEIQHDDPDDYVIPNGTMQAFCGELRQAKELDARKLLRHICQICGIFGRIVNGVFKVFSVSAHDVTTSTFDVPYYKSFEYEDYSTQPINTITIRESQSDEGMTAEWGESVDPAKLWVKLDPHQLRFDSKEEFVEFYRNNFTPYDQLSQNAIEIEGDYEISGYNNLVLYKNSLVYNIDRNYLCTPIGIARFYPIEKAVRFVMVATGLRIDQYTREVSTLIEDIVRELQVDYYWPMYIGGVCVHFNEQGFPWHADKQFIQDCIHILFQKGAYYFPQGNENMLKKGQSYDLSLWNQQTGMEHRTQFSESVSEFLLRVKQTVFNLFMSGDYIETTSNNWGNFSATFDKLIPRLQMNIDLDSKDYYCCARFYNIDTRKSPTATKLTITIVNAPLNYALTKRILVTDYRNINPIEIGTDWSSAHSVWFTDENGNKSLNDLKEISFTFATNQNPPINNKTGEMYVLQTPVTPYKLVMDNSLIQKQAEPLYPGLSRQPDGRCPAAEDAIEYMYPDWHHCEFTTLNPNYIDFGEIPTTLYSLGESLQQIQSETWNGWYEIYDTNAYVVQNNIFWYDQSQIAKEFIIFHLFNEVQNISVIPFKAEFKCFPWIECGDFVAFNSPVDGYKKVRIMSNEINNVAAMMQKSSAEGDEYQKLFLTDIGTRIDSLEEAERRNALSEEETEEEVDSIDSRTRGIEFVPIIIEDDKSSVTVSVPNTYGNIVMISPYAMVNGTYASEIQTTVSVNASEIVLTKPSAGFYEDGTVFTVMIAHV